MNNGRELIGRKWQITNQGDRNLFIQKVCHPYHDERLWEENGKYFNQHSSLNSLGKKGKVGAYTPTKLKSVSKVSKSETMLFLKFPVTLQADSFQEYHIFTHQQLFSRNKFGNIYSIFYSIILNLKTNNFVQSVTSCVSNNKHLKRLCTKQVQFSMGFCGFFWPFQCGLSELQNWATSRREPLRVPFWSSVPPSHLYSLINHPSIISDHSYGIAEKRTMSSIRGALVFQLRIFLNIVHCSKSRWPPTK